MAFAIASGMSPTAGIWTAIVAGFLITSAFGGSRVQIGGPTGAFIPIIYGIVADHGVQNLLGATMLAGVMLLAMGAPHGQHDPLHPGDGGDRLHQRHRRRHLPRPDQGFPRPADRQPARRVLRQASSAWPPTAHTVDLPTLALASVAACCCRGTAWPSASPGCAALPGPLAVLVVGTASTFV
jgi:SulP family sulfate permease